MECTKTVAKCSNALNDARSNQDLLDTNAVSNRDTSKGLLGNNRNMIRKLIAI